MITLTTNKGIITSEVQEQITRAQIAVDRLQVSAEVTGVVKGFSLRPGDVVTAGEDLFQIVPTSARLVAD